MAREWNLSWPKRMVIIGCAVTYLLFARPWNAPSLAEAKGIYTCLAAMLTLALIPRRTRLWVAFCAAVSVPVLADIATAVARLSG